ncbi:MAG TPA: hypothetical protein VF533_19190 [Solirubrobacteraceae bacterium]
MRAFTATLLAAAAAVALLPAAPVAAQSQRPTAKTGRAAAVSPTSANLTGSSNPNGRPTQVFVQYGLGAKLNEATPPQDIGSGTRAVPVRVDVTNLRPNSKYSFRLVARSGTVRTNGAIKTFKTSKVPVSVTLAAAPAVVTFGDSVVLSGTVGGTGSANARVQPELRPFPFNAPFAPAGNALIATAEGAYNFQTTPQVSTDYRSNATVNGKVTFSPTIRVGVAPRVTLRIKRLKNKRVRFRGDVAPGGDAVVRLIRISKSGKRKTLKKTTTRGSDLDSFKFKKRKVRKKYDFVVNVTPANGAFVPGESRVRTVKPKR